MNEQMAENKAKRFSPHGADLFGEPAQKAHTSKLGDEFLIPPFTVLSAREGWWQDRKRAWLDMGIQSELGRGESAGSDATGVGGGKHYTNGSVNAMKYAGGFSKRHGFIET